MSSNSPCYLSGPNDIWSLGIILVNLTCGRNPWKRASIEDSTFRAYLKNPKFLSSILPLTPELDSILRRIFECDPRRRIQIPELRELILRCPRFTTHPAAAPPSLSCEVGCKADPFAVCLETNNYSSTPLTPCSSRPGHPRAVQYSQRTISSSGSSTSSDGSSRSASSTSSSSSYADDQPERSSYAPPKPRGNFYGQFIPIDPAPKSLVFNQCFPSVQVC
jgi:serine/threonine protein kinase